MLAPSANTLPKGHVLIEPYVYDVIQYGAYDSDGTLKPAQHANGYGSLTYIIYGLTDRFNVGITPTFGFNTVSHGLNSSRVRFGDLALLAQYRLMKSTPDRPTVSINVQETLPTAKYDRLDRSTDGFGSGVYTTTISLYSQQYVWMANGRILRLRLNLSDAFSGVASVEGASVYGTGPSFHGSVRPGTTFTADAAAEYSVSRRSVLALDVVYRGAGTTEIRQSGSVINLDGGHSYALAPAYEYNFNANVGVLIGLRLIPAGVNASATVTPAIAVNIVH